MIRDDGQRWGIETRFACWKTRGFNLESTHFSNPERVSRLVALLSITLCWAFRVGEWCNQRQPIKLKKHGRKAQSIFRLGLDDLRHLFLNLSFHTDSDFITVLRFLSCT